MLKKTPSATQLTPLLLRAGLAIIFLYAGISSLKNPDSWIIYLPSFVRTSASAMSLLHVFSVYELLLAIWLIVGRYVKYAALLCALTFAGIVVVNFNAFIITFRDIALIFMALALFFAG